MCTPQQVAAYRAEDGKVLVQPSEIGCGCCEKTTVHFVGAAHETHSDGWSGMVVRADYSDRTFHPCPKHRRWRRNPAYYDYPAFPECRRPN
jgi:hypothetical protein